MKKFFQEILDLVVSFAAPYRKAVVGALVGAVISWLSVKGVKVDAGVQDALVSGISGLLAGFLVFLVPNTKVK